MDKQFKDLAKKTSEKRKIQQIGNSKMVGIPDTFLAWAGFKESEEVTVMVDANKKGQRYIAIFKE